MAAMQGHIDPTQLTDEQPQAEFASEAEIMGWIKEQYPNETRITNALYTVLGNRYLALKGVLDTSTPQLGGDLDWKDVPIKAGDLIWYTAT